MSAEQGRECDTRAGVWQKVSRLRSMPWPTGPLSRQRKSEEEARPTPRNLSSHQGRVGPLYGMIGQDIRGPLRVDVPPLGLSLREKGEAMPRINPIAAA
jgi:hypothetical protein